MRKSISSVLFFTILSVCCARFLPEIRREQLEEMGFPGPHGIDMIHAVNSFNLVSQQLDPAFKGSLLLSACEEFKQGKRIEKLPEDFHYSAAADMNWKTVENSSFRQRFDYWRSNVMHITDLPVKGAMLRNLCTVVNESNNNERLVESLFE